MSGLFRLMDFCPRKSDMYDNRHRKKCLQCYRNSLRSGTSSAWDKGPIKHPNLPGPGPIYASPSTNSSSKLNRHDSAKISPTSLQKSAFVANQRTSNFHVRTQTLDRREPKLNPIRALTSIHQQEIIRHHIYLQNDKHYDFNTFALTRNSYNDLLLLKPPTLSLSDSLFP